MSKTLPSSQLLRSFFQALKATPQCALMLDYDGTLAPFRVQPEKAVPYPGVREILSKLLKGQRTRVVLISGRWTKDLIPLLKPDPLPEIWGSHGWERLRADGTYEIAAFNDWALRGLAEADRWVEEKGLAGRCEHKPGCLALHWRGLAPEKTRGIYSKAITKWTLLAKKTGLILSEFDGGLELRVPGRNKGHAVKTILAEMGNDSMAAYLGDDITDEDAFKAIKGRGLGILARDEYRSTAADLWLTPPEELLEFLLRWHKTRGGRR